MNQKTKAISYEFRKKLKGKTRTNLRQRIFFGRLYAVRVCVGKYRLTYSEISIELEVLASKPHQSISLARFFFRVCACAPKNIMNMHHICAIGFLCDFRMVKIT